jgi:hypothetical protein
VLKQPSLRVSPLRGRLAGFAERPWPAQPLALLVLSALLGGLTHLVWDGITHAGGYGPRNVAALRTIVHVPLAGDMLLHRVVQHSSTVIGLAILAIVIGRALARVTPRELPSPGARVYAIWAISIVVVTALSLLRIRGLNLVDPGSVVVAILSGLLGGAIVASVATR